MFRSKPPIGVDIGSHTVKVIQMQRSGNGYELIKFGMAELYPEGEPPGDPQKRIEAQVNALHRALEDAQIKARHSVSSVCGESIIVRYLQLPEMPEDELRNALQWEAEEYIPFRLSEVNLDSVVLSLDSGEDHPKMDVLLVSAKKDLINNHVSVLRGVSLDPKIVDVDAFAFLNCFEHNHQPGADSCAVLVNIGNEITSINVVNGGVSRFSRDIPIGGQTLTTAIKSRLGCSYAEAERLKIDFGAPAADQLPEELDIEQENSFGSALMDAVQEKVEPTDGDATVAESREAQVQRAVRGVLENLFSEVRRSIEFFENQYRGTNVSLLVLGGGTASLKNLSVNFQKELQLPVEMIDPLRHISVGSKCNDPQRVQAVRHQLGVSVGLGLRGMAAA